MTPDTNQITPVFSREKWLETALDCLGQTRKSKFNLESLIQAMPVTKGSFYSHFKNREDFLIALVDFWDRHFTKSIIDALGTLPEDTEPGDVLWELQLAIHDLGLNQHELLIRSMTLELEVCENGVRKVDEERYTAVSGIFARLGFEGDELDMRTRMFLVAISQESNLFLDKHGPIDLKKIRLRHEFFIRP